jgi:hypothetical protein
MSNRPTVAGIGVVVGALALGSTITVWGTIRDYARIGGATALLFSLCLAGFALLGWRALTRHRALAAAAKGPYVTRHSGLIWGLGMSSALTYTMARQQLATASGVEEQLWLLALLGVVCVPFALWGGLLFRRTLECGLGIKPPDA